MTAAPIEHRPAKAWLKITVQADPCISEAVAAYLAALTGTGLEISSQDNDQATKGHSAGPDKIIAYLPLGTAGLDEKATARKTEELKLFLAKACHVFPNCPAPHFVTETVMEEDWGKKWKSFFTALQITPTLTIKPSWEEAEEPESEGKHQKLVIEMDPGLAFGTGHHASTQLALQLLEKLYQQRPVKPGKVLDVGTGSGILAMACALFGAKEVMALDHDIDAVATAKANIRRNRLDDRIAVSSRDIEAIVACFDIVVANITHDILAGLAAHLAGRINPNGFLVLSGILKGDQEKSIRGIYAKKRMEFTESLTKDEWAALLFRKK